MRLVRLGSAASTPRSARFARTPTVRSCSPAKMAAEGVTVGLFPEQVIGGYPPEDLVQWQGFVEGQWPQLERFAQETAALPTVSSSASPSLHAGPALQLRGGGRRRTRPRPRARRRSCPPTTSSTRAAPSPAACPGMTRDAPGRPLRRLIFRFDFGIDGARGLRGPLEPGRPDAAAHLRRRRAGLQHLRLPLPARRRADTRREMIATRAADHQCTLAYANLVGANDGLIFDGGGYVNQNGKLMLDAPRFREGFAAAPSISTAPAPPRGEHHLAHRPRGTTWRDARAGAHHRRADGVLHRVEPRDADLSGAGARQLLPARPDAAPRSPREELCEEILDALRSGSATTSRRSRAFQHHRRRALAAAGTRC